MTEEAQSINPETLEDPGPKGVAPSTFKYVAKELKYPKGATPLCKSDIMLAMIQQIKEGGENNLHSHAGLDGFWFVLAGRARFYGTGDELIGEFGKHEGVFLPRGVAYWFESADPDETLQLLQVEAIAKDVENVRTDYVPRTKGTIRYQVFDAETPATG